MFMFLVLSSHRKKLLIFCTRKVHTCNHGLRLPKIGIHKLHLVVIVITGLVPRPPPFFVLQFAFTVIHKAEDQTAA